MERNGTNGDSVTREYQVQSQPKVGHPKGDIKTRKASEKSGAF
jgi:hypothetical protein